MNGTTRYCFVKDGKLASQWFYKLPEKQAEAIARKLFILSVPLWRWLKKHNRIEIRKQQLINGSWSEVK